MFTQQKEKEIPLNSPCGAAEVHKNDFSTSRAVDIQHIASRERERKAVLGHHRRFASKAVPLPEQGTELRFLATSDM